MKHFGYTIENDVATMKMGDNGIMYVSYEDATIYSGLFGIEKATNQKDYENIYQYNDFGSFYQVDFEDSKGYMGNIFNKKTEGKEYLTQIAIDTPETYTCKVYINKNGKSMAKNDLIPVALQAGESETFNRGYHTLEFAEPIEITAKEFAIVVEIQGTRNNKISILGEANIPKSMLSNSAYDLVEVERGKCFFAGKSEFEQNSWQDLSQLSQESSGEILSIDSSIKAFTTSKVEGDVPQKPAEDKNYTNFEEAECTMKVLKAYFSSNANQKEYSTMELEINHITREQSDNNCEYYYYLSQNQKEENIEDWVKIEEKQTQKDKLNFTINTNDVKNYSELSKSDTLYLYVKEVVTKNGKQTETISNSMLLEEKGASFEFYMDNVKLDNFNALSGKIPKDETVANKILPKTGMKTIILVISVIGIIGILVWIRYKYLSKYVK